MPRPLDQLAQLREEYSLTSLSEHAVDPNPIRQFETWFQEAMEAQIPDSNAMALSTVDQEGKPHSRIVLLKGVEQDEFIFFTNYRSHKGMQISGQPAVSLLFFWKELQRQVRIDGFAKTISESASDAYFSTRPRESQLGACASAQSEEIASRELLEQNYQQLQQQFEGNPIQRPPHWGGYAVKPVEFEFWQGRMSRLHDRIVYRLNEQQSWEIVRLNP